MNISHYIDQSEKLYKEQDSIYRKAAAGFGMSDSVLCILYMLLYPDGESTQQNLCLRCCYPKQTVNTAIANLKANGYVTLEPLPGSRHTKRILLTPSGLELAQRSAALLREAETRAYSRLSDSELETFIRLSARLNAALQEEFSTFTP